VDGLHLYNVSIANIDGRKIEFLVATWNGPHKAVAMAVLANAARSRPIRIHDVDLVDLGNLASKTIPPKALVDRMEF
jgi:hypothetical protein